jgi:hypothetical protein
MQVETTHELREVDEVLRWRREQLTGIGFDETLAGRLAGDARWDLHAVIELVERGCPPPLAARILAPLDGAPLEEGAEL